METDLNNYKEECNYLGYTLGSNGVMVFDRWASTNELVIYGDPIGIAEPSLCVKVSDTSDEIRVEYRALIDKLYETGEL